MTPLAVAYFLKHFHTNRNVDFPLMTESVQKYRLYSTSLGIIIYKI